MNAQAGIFGEGVRLPFILDEELYNKLLFKTLSFQDLKLELKRRSIACSVSDTYYVLALKLRLQILKDSNADSVHVQPIIDEINYFALQQKKSLSYHCSLPGCPFRAHNHKDYVKHLRALHSNSKQKMLCKLKGCGQEFGGVQLLELHIKQAHRTRLSLVKLKQNQLVLQISRLRCLSTSCHHQCAL